jgi:hypothetical protein
MSYGAFPVPRDRIEGALVRRAWSDPRFKALLLSDPRQAIKEELGVDVGDGLQVDVEEERSDRMVVVLPVDLSGFLPPSVNAMMGRTSPPPRSSASPRPPVAADDT